jgi:glycosyltransferase involved in cell wall biosynthesis
MKIAVLTTLGDNLISAKMIPLSRVAAVSDVLFVSDAPGPSIPGVRYFVPPRWLYRVAVHKSVAKLLLLFAVVMRHRPGIVMAYNVLPHGYSAWLVGRLLRKKVFQHLIGGLSDVRAEPDTSDNSLIRRFPRLCRLITAINHWIVVHSDKVFVPGHATRDRLVQEFRVPPERVTILHSTIDVERFKVRERTRQYDLVMAATLSRRKNIAFFLNVVALLKQSIPKVRVAILGEGPYRDRLMARAAELGISDNVSFLGYRKDTEEYYARAKVFVLTSKFEGLSCAAMEAMACGLPIVAPNIGDMSAIAIDGVTGFLIDGFDDPLQYMEKIKLLLRDRDLYANCSRESVEIIQHEHSFASAERLWTEILNGHL